MAWRKNSLKYLFIGGEKFVTPMPRRCRHRLCLDWLEMRTYCQNFDENVFIHQVGRKFLSSRLRTFEIAETLT